MPHKKKLPINTDSFHFPKCNTEYVSFYENMKMENIGNRILILCTFSTFSGLEMHCLQQHKAFITNGCLSKILVPKNSVIEKKLIEEKLPFYAYENYGLFTPKSMLFKAHRQPGLAAIISEIIKRDKIEIINCNRAKDLFLLKKVPRGKIKIVLTRHAPTLVKKKFITQFDGIIGVNFEFISKTKKKQLKNKKIPMTQIAPFFENPGEMHSPKICRQEFLKKQFGVNTQKNSTMIITIGVLNKRKNQPLILKAMDKLINKKQISVELLICGSGPTENYLKRLSKKLNIDQNVHFLGFTNKRLQAIHYSDIKVLTSKTDANPIVLKEAAILKKPLIAPTQTGATDSIKDGITGLLFKNGNVDDLADKMERLIKNKNLQKKYGENGHRYIKNNFMPDQLAKKTISFYSKL